MKQNIDGDREILAVQRSVTQIKRKHPDCFLMEQSGRFGILLWACYLKISEKIELKIRMQYVQILRIVAEKVALTTSLRP